MLHTRNLRRSRQFAAFLILSVLASLPFATPSANAQSGGSQSAPDPLVNGKTALADGSDALLACTPPFSDVHSTDFYYDSVRYLYCSGAIGGYADNTYRPGNTTSRGQFSKIAVTAMGWTLENPSSPSFNDVPPGSTFYQYIETASSHNVIGGYADGSFRPDENITRGQLVKITMLSEAWPLLNPNLPSFSDVPLGSPFFSFIETATSRDVIGGYADGSFRPGGTATRGQVAKVIYYARTSLLYSQEQDTINIINARRASMGLVTLQLDPALHRATRRHVFDIGPQALCQHNGTDGTSPWDRAAQAGFTGFAMGEVVGCGYTSPTGVVDGWWNSPGHYAVLTDPNARYIGCGWWINPQGAGWQACLTGS